MTQYLLSIYQPDGPAPPPAELGKIMTDVASWTDDVRAAGAWVFNAGLHGPETATVMRVQNGEMLMTDGPFVEGKEHIGGFCVIAADDLDAALAWGEKLARATTLPIEVRPVQEDRDA